jgi:hypothetical protein
MISTRFASVLFPRALSFEVESLSAAAYSNKLIVDPEQESEDFTAQL